MPQKKSKAVLKVSPSILLLFSPVIADWKFQPRVSFTLKKVCILSWVVFSNLWELQLCLNITPIFRGMFCEQSLRGCHRNYVGYVMISYILQGIVSGSVRVGAD